ncbi:pathogenesis-related leaf protein 4 [Prunus yedoensis var. nudiflora]|uniref:Pathogenesis-related leaf protein 4 n=1 Tax=Prunus yedoensis var. nudiflora TaxID=2094558 RepID=A0A314U702_PRUYE|nr:pathogenesis-related leaf protein 4 [Prunus yedoensis var. nudiflora]
MGLSKISFAFVCLIGLALLQSTSAQDSPQDYLNAHNAARAQVGVAPLTWDPNLAAYAQS